MGAMPQGVRWLPIPLAVVAAVVGWFVLGDTLNQHAGAHLHAYQAGGLSLSVNEMVWMSNDMSGQGPLASKSQGFAMAQSMMPGMQTTDNNRLRLGLTLRNDTGDPQQFALSDFRVIAPNGQSWGAVDDGGAVLHRQSMLGPGYATTVDVYFDIPIAQTKNLAVEWSNGGTTVEIPVDTSGAPPAHTH